MFPTKDRLPPPNSEIANDRERLIKLLEYQGDHPLGKDPFNSLASQTLARNGVLVDTIMDVRQIRQELNHPLTLSHATHLATIEAPNWVMMKRGRINYPAKTDLDLQKIENWDVFWGNILSDPKLLNDYKYALVNGNSQRTEISRGVTLPHVVHTLFGNKPITAVDYGCSANWVWSHLANRKQFKNHHEWYDEYVAIDDYTGVFKSEVDHPINLKCQTGVDRLYPFAHERTKEWFLACRHIKDIKSSQMAQTEVRIERYKNVPNVNVIIADLMAGSPIDNHSVDVLTMSWFLYQMPERIRTSIIEDARNKLTDKGVLIIQDFVSATDDGKNIQFSPTREVNSTVITGPAVDNYWLEIAQYDGTACREIYPGKHLDLFESIGQITT